MIYDNTTWLTQRQNYYMQLARQYRTDCVDLLSESIAAPCMLSAWKNTCSSLYVKTITTKSKEGLHWSVGRRNYRIINKCVPGRDLTGKLTNESHALKPGHERRTVDEQPLYQVLIWAILRYW